LQCADASQKRHLSAKSTEAAGFWAVKMAELEEGSMRSGSGMQAWSRNMSFQVPHTPNKWYGSCGLHLCGGAFGARFGNVDKLKR
jgi:hypothetical protein